MMYMESYTQTYATFKTNKIIYFLLVITYTKIFMKKTAE